VVFLGTTLFVVGRGFNSPVQQAVDDQ